VKLSLLLAVAMALAACSSCTPAPASPSDAAPPSPGPPSPSDPTELVYTELVEGGCLAPDDSGDGYAAIYELETSDAAPSWLICLYRGGTVASCMVPCGND